MGPREHWSDAASCYLCLQPFSVSLWRHHCRACGEAVCNACSSGRCPVVPRRKDNEEEGKKPKKKRVCITCYEGFKALPGRPFLVAGQPAGKHDGNVSECAICLERVQTDVVRLCDPLKRPVCDHTFHGRCVHQLKSLLCPLCRTRFACSVPEAEVREEPVSVPPSPLSSTSSSSSASPPVHPPLVSRERKVLGAAVIAGVIVSGCFLFSFSRCYDFVSHASRRLTARQFAEGTLYIAFLYCFWWWLTFDTPLDQAEYLMS